MYTFFFIIASQSPSRLGRTDACNAKSRLYLLDMNQTHLLERNTSPTVYRLRLLAEHPKIRIHLVVTYNPVQKKQAE